MNSSIQAIGPSQSVKPSFGGKVIEPFTIYHPKHPALGIKINDWQQFKKTIEALPNIDVVIGEDAVKMVRRRPAVDKTENLDHIVKGAYRHTHIPERDTEVHYVNIEQPVLKKMGRIGINFEDGTYLMENRAVERADLNKYGKGKLQRMIATLEYVAKELNDSVKNMELFNLYGKFSK